MLSSWDRIRTFLAVLDAGSLSAAARQLRLTQPTVGRHIDELEAELGAALFTRSPAGLEPTETALSLRSQAETMAAAADSLARSATAEAEEERGTVRLTASEVVGVEVLPPILAALRRAHPAIAIELVISNRNQDLLHRDSDIAVRMVPPSQAALVQRRVGTIELGLFARQDYLQRHGTPADFAGIAGHGLIGYDTENTLIRELQRRQLIPPRNSLSLRTDNDLAMIAAVRAGWGIGAMQVPLAARDPRLVRVLPDFFRMPLECWVAMHEDLKRVRRMRLVFDHLAEGLAAYIAGREGDS